MTNNEELGYLDIDSSLYHTRISDKFRNRKAYEPSDPNVICSFIPGTILDVFISVGDAVKVGDELMILDAMKMKNRIKCSINGTVKSIAVKSGDKVSKGTVLLNIE